MSGAPDNTSGAETVTAPVITFETRPTPFPEHLCLGCGVRMALHGICNACEELGVRL